MPLLTLTLFLLAFCFVDSVSWTYQKSENAGTESTIVEDGVLKSDYADMFSLVQTNYLNFLSVTTSSGGKI